MRKYLALTLIPLISGCAGPKIKECNLSGVSIEIIPEDKVSNYCKAVLLSEPDLGDEDGTDFAGIEVYGCSDTQEKHIVSRPDAGTLWHELSHLCGIANP